MPRCVHGHYRSVGSPNSGKAAYCRLCYNEHEMPFFTRPVHLRDTHQAQETQAVYANKNDGRCHCLKCGESAWYYEDERTKEIKRCAACDAIREG